MFCDGDSTELEFSTHIHHIDVALQTAACKINKTADEHAALGVVAVERGGGDRLDDGDDKRRRGEKRHCKAIALVWSVDRRALNRDLKFGRVCVRAEIISTGHNSTRHEARAVCSSIDARERRAFCLLAFSTHHRPAASSSTMQQWRRRPLRRRPATSTTRSDDDELDTNDVKCRFLTTCDTHCKRLLRRSRRATSITKREPRIRDAQLVETGECDTHRAPQPPPPKQS